VFVNHLLLTFRFHDNCKVVKCFDQSADLEPIHQIYDHRNVLATDLIQKVVLDIDLLFVHGFTPTLYCLRTIREIDTEFLLKNLHHLLNYVFKIVLLHIIPYNIRNAPKP
jgi:hypothetical protein